MPDKFIEEISSTGQIFYVNERHAEIIQASQDFNDLVLANPEDYPKIEIPQHEFDEYAATEYSRSRIAEYAKLNQDEMRYDDLVNGTTTWQDAIAAIKASYPKP